jgi:hypothetical protein
MNYTLLMASMTETAGTPARSVEIIDYLKLRLNHFGEDHLSDPHAARHGKRLFRVIDQDDLDLAAVVGVDRPGGIEERDPVFDRKAAPGTDLGLEMFGKGDKDTRGDQSPFPRVKGDGLSAGGQKINAARAFGLILRERKAFEMR